MPAGPGTRRHSLEDGYGLDADAILLGEETVETMSEIDVLSGHVIRLHDALEVAPEAMAYRMRVDLAALVLPGAPIWVSPSANMDALLLGWADGG